MLFRGRNWTNSGFLKRTCGDDLEKEGVGVDWAAHLLLLIDNLDATRPSVQGRILVASFRNKLTDRALHDKSWSPTGSDTTTGGEEESPALINAPDSGSGHSAICPHQLSRPNDANSNTGSPHPLSRNSITTRSLYLHYPDVVDCCIFRCTEQSAPRGPRRARSQAPLPLAMEIQFSIPLARPKNATQGR